MSQENRGEERIKLLDEIGDNRHTLVWTEDLGFVWLNAYFMLGFIGAPFVLFILPRTTPTMMMVIWIGLAAIIGVTGWWRVREKARTKSIKVDRNGFRIYDANNCTFEQRWETLRSITKTRNATIFCRTNGTQESVSIPEVKRTREAQEFLEILKTFQVPKDSSMKRKKWFWILLSISVVGLLGAAIFGRPPMLAKDYDGPIGFPQYLSVAIWGVSFCCILVGIHGLGYFATIYFTRREKAKQRLKVSKFGPNVQEYLDETNNWPKPVKMEKGKKYRYMDPDGVIRSIKDQIAELWLLFGLLQALLWFFVIAIGIGVRQKPMLHDDWVGLGIASTVLVIGSIIPITFVSGRKRRLIAVEDVISIEPGLIIVKRNGVTLRFDAKPNREMSDSFPQKESKKPFRRVERFGVKPDVYEMDRRFLVEVDKDEI